MFQSLDQIDQFQKELLQVLADFVLDLDWESEVHLGNFLGLQKNQILCQIPQKFEVRDLLFVERGLVQMLEKL